MMLQSSICGNVEGLCIMVEVSVRTPLQIVNLPSAVVINHQNGPSSGPMK